MPIYVFVTTIRGDKNWGGPKIIARSFTMAEKVLDELIEDGEVPINTYIDGKFIDEIPHDEEYEL